MKYTIYCILLSLCPILALNEIDTCLQELADVNTNLAIKTYSVIHQQTCSNFVYSPFGMDIMLTYFYMASNRQSRDQIAATGCVPRQIVCFNVFLSRLYSQRQSLFKIASRMFIRDDIRLNPIFAENATKYLQTTTSSVYYRDRSDEAVKTINSWVQQQMIYDDKVNVIELEDIHKSTNMIFVGVIFSDLYWKYQFVPYINTFYTLFSEVLANMMETYGTFNYCDSVELGAEFVEIPYVDNNEFTYRPLSLVIVLPNDRDGISRLESNLDTVFTQLILEPTNLKVTIPSLQIENTLDTKETLRNIGVTDVFDIDKADFSNLAYHNCTRYYVTRATQTTQIVINPVGTTAKSASENDHPTRTRSLYLNYQNFVADHPFIYYIQRDNVILYAGRVMDL